MVNKLTSSSPPPLPAVTTATAQDRSLLNAIAVTLEKLATLLVRLVSALAPFLHSVVVLIPTPSAMKNVVNLSLHDHKM